MKQPYYDDLPDYVSTVKSRKIFADHMLDFYQNQINRNDFLEVLFDISYRRNIYDETLSESLRCQIDRAVCSFWPVDDDDAAEDMAMATDYLGLSRSFELLKNIQDTIDLSKETKGFIAKLFENTTVNNIADPRRIEMENAHGGNKYYLPNFKKVGNFPDSTLAKYRTIVSDDIIWIWENYGLGTFCGGYFRVIDPVVITNWPQDGSFGIPIFATAFGDLVLFYPEATVTQSFRSSGSIAVLESSRCDRYNEYYYSPAGMIHMMIYLPTYQRTAHYFERHDRSLIKQLYHKYYMYKIMGYDDVLNIANRSERYKHGLIPFIQNNILYLRRIQKAHHQRTLVAYADLPDHLSSEELDSLLSETMIDCYQHQVNNSQCLEIVSILLDRYLTSRVPLFSERLVHIKKFLSCHATTAFFKNKIVQQLETLNKTNTEDH